MLGSMLNQHKKIYWEGEVYNKAAKKLNPNPVEISSNYADKIIEYFENQLEKTRKPFFGFEVKPFHISKYLGKDIKDYITSLNDTVDYFIVLKRKNFLRKIVSSLVAQSTGFYHMGKKNKSQLKKININFNKINIDFKEKSLIEFLDEYDLAFRKFSEFLNDKKNLLLTYEDHIQENPFIAYNAVCEFINLDIRKPKINYLKTNPFALNNIVINFDELKEYLTNTKYEWMLYE